VLVAVASAALVRHAWNFVSLARYNDRPLLVLLVSMARDVDAPGNDDGALPIDKG